MQIHNLKIEKSQRRRKRVGRGGKKGTYSGRGNKGQKARSGVSLDPLFEGGRSSLVDRMKKIKGFKSFKPKNLVLKLSLLEKKFKDGDLINREALIASGYFGSMETQRRKIKILNSPGFKTKLKISSQEIYLSASAQKTIKAVGGEILASLKK